MDIIHKTSLWFVFFTIFLYGSCLVQTDTDNHKDNELVYKRDAGTLGVWWWQNDKNNDAYLAFAEKNSVNEIYFSTADFSNHTAAFIEKAHSRGISVFLLVGEYEYIEDAAGFSNLMDNFIVYQNRVEHIKRFSGVHLDVEPHQHPDFSSRRKELLNDYLDFVISIGKKYDIPFDFDIPFWFDDKVVYQGKNVPLYEAIIDEANRVFVMSYRNTAEKMYETSKDKIEYAKKNNKQIVLGAETDYSAEGDTVSYYEEGKKYMYAEFKKLNNLVNYDNCGLSIHHIKSWYEQNE